MMYNGAEVTHPDAICAIEGSHVSNGDVIEKSRHPRQCVIDIREGMPPVPGFLQQGYVPPLLPGQKA